MISASPTFCPCPWTTVNIDQAGVVKPCLSSYEYQQDLGNVNQQSIQEIIAGPRGQLLRQRIAQGLWDPLCAGCQRIEAVGGSSPRHAAIAEWGAEIGPQIDQNINNLILRDITVNWSNLCNLTCTYCNPGTSTRWQAVRNLPVTVVKNSPAGLIELAEEHAETIRGLSLGGGEPLLQKGLPEFLLKIRPEQTSVMITTNLSVDLESNPVYQTLRQWPNVSWSVSFDNVNKERFEYVRNGADWDLFVANIDQLKREGQSVVAHPAYSIYCALSLVEYYEFCRDRDLDVYWCDLQHPHALDIRRQPIALRRAAQAEIDRVVELYSNRPGNWSLATLENYRIQLENPPAQTATVDPVAWHREQERILTQQHRFEDLWPEYQAANL